MTLNFVTPLAAKLQNFFGVFLHFQIGVDINAPEIAAMNTCYGYLVSGECDVLTMACLLGFDDPLARMRSAVLKEQNTALPDQIDRVLRTLRSQGAAKRSRNPSVFTPLCPVRDYSTL